MKIIPKPLRVTGIILCGLMLLVPPGMCFTGAQPRWMELAHLISILSPLPFLVLVALCIDEGRERERERAEEEKRG